jgi:hypothetical protein
MTQVPKTGSHGCVCRHVYPSPRIFAQSIKDKRLRSGLVAQSPDSIGDSVAKYFKRMV